MKHFNGLTPAEAERLTLLASEAAEVIQAITKVQLHGYEGHHPDRPMATNRIELEEELGHFQNALRLMYDAKDVDPAEVLASRIRKSSSFITYLHHQPKELW